MQEEMRWRTWEAPLAPGCGKAVVRYTGRETRKGKPGNSIIPEPKGADWKAAQVGGALP